MVDGERGSDGCSRMDVHAGFGMCYLSHHTWNEGNAHHEELVSHTKDGQRLNHRIASQYLGNTGGSGIAVVCGYDICTENPADGWQAADQLCSHFPLFFLERLQILDTASGSR